MFLSAVFSLWSLFGLISLAPAFAKKNQDKQKPSIILVISDGTGFQHVELGRLVEYGVAGRESTYKLLDALRPIMTYNSESTLTDSAAAATAISAGVLTTNGRVSQDADGEPVETFIEYLHDKHPEYATGIAVKYYLTHATPAGFLCHASHRNNSEELADSLLNDGSAADVMIGAGDNNSRYLTREAYLAEWRNKGYNVMTSDDYKGPGSLSTQKSPFLGIFGKNSPENLSNPASRGDRMGWYIERTDENNSKEPTLLEMTQEAVRMLKDTGKPFFLMVEASMVDTAAHSNDKTRLIGESIELELVLRQIKEWIDDKSIVDDLRLLVTADHETGGTTTPDTLETLAADTEVPDRWCYTGTPHERTISELNEIRKRRIDEITVSFGWNEHTTTYVMLGGHGKYAKTVNSAQHIMDIRKILEAFTSGTEEKLGYYPGFTYEEPVSESLAVLAGFFIALGAMGVILIIVFMSITRCCKKRLVILKAPQASAVKAAARAAELGDEISAEIQIADTKDLV